VRVVAGEDAHLVVLEAAAAQIQAALLDADAGAVAMGHPGAEEGDVVDAEVAVTDHPDGLVLGGPPIRHQFRLASHPADGELALGPYRHVAAIAAGGDLHHVPVPGQAGGLGDGGEPAGADADRRRQGRGGGQGQEGDASQAASPTVAKKLCSPKRLKSPKRFSLSFTGSFISAKHNSMSAAYKLSSRSLR